MWLIETWDVLKYDRDPEIVFDTWLIETWDVLKWIKYSGVSYSISINRNMRCIEMRDSGKIREQDED